MVVGAEVFDVVVLVVVFVADVRVFTVVVGCGFTVPGFPVPGPEGVVTTMPSQYSTHPLKAKVLITVLIPVTPVKLHHCDTWFEGTGVFVGYSM